MLFTKYTKGMSWTVPRKETAELKAPLPKTTKNDKQSILIVKLISVYVTADRPLECEFIHIFHRLRNGSFTEMRVFYFQYSNFKSFPK